MRRPGPLTVVRIVELRDGVGDLTDVAGAERVRVYASWDGRILGYAEILNRRQAVSAARLRAALAAALQVRLLPQAWQVGDAIVWAELVSALAGRMQDGGPAPVAARPARPGPSASVVVATLDRPDDLRECLRQLREQVTASPVEVVVVDNNPDSGGTAAVLAEFPDVVAVSERRRGLSYARNTGIRAAGGEIVVMTDDDVRMPPDWLDALLAPFARPDVSAVTGNVLPLELRTRSQRLFEIYGGLGRGFDPQEFDATWLERFRSAAPTWKLGATANAAFRASVLRDVGLLHEALGAGMPAAVGEDTLLFYRVLKAGHTLVYEPRAHVWHRHRPDMAGLRKQLYGYSKGHVAYHLTTLVEDRDLRALHYLLVRLPKVHVRRITERLRGRAPYPLPLNLLEIAGNLAGPAAFVQSRRRVRNNAAAHRGEEA